jgi:hypothetical protein
MNRINTSRQTIASRQRNANYRPSYSIAPHVLTQTLCDSRFEGREVIFSVAHDVIEVGSLLITPGEHFYLIASKFVNRFYVMTRDGKSSGGAELQAKHLQMVKAFIAARKAAA